MARIIFHHPGPLFEGGDRGSTVRPANLLRAFKEIGYVVDTVVGYGRERKSSIKVIKKNIEAGIKYDFIYSEARTIPTLLTEKNRFPSYPLLDFLFFRYARKKSISIGLFYRDIYWRTSSYKEILPWYGRLITVPLYYYDWFFYKKYVNLIFLPTKRMQTLIPVQWNSSDIAECPPGHSSPDIAPRINSASPIKLFYVGGVLPPVYDITPLVRLAKVHRDIEVVICCRESEWQKISKYYLPLSGNISVVHKNSFEIKELYEASTISAIIWEPTEYLRINTPIKLYEAIGYEKPVITITGTAASELVIREDIGWVYSSQEDLAQLISSLKLNSHLIDSKILNLKKMRDNHSWSSRAKYISQILGSIYLERIK